MSLLVAEGFDQYGTDATLLSDGGPITYIETPANTSIQAGLGRCGTNALQITGVGIVEVYFSPNITDQFSWGGAAIWLESLASRGRLIGWLSTLPSLQCFVAVLTNGAIEFWQGPNFTTKLATSAPALVNQQTWFYLEWEVLVHPSAGTCQFWIDGVEAIPLTTGLDTQAGVFGTPGDYASVSVSGPNKVRYDDVVMGDGADSGVTGKPNDGRIGVVHLTYVEAELDSVASGGFYKNWTVLSGTDHGAMVDETPHDGDTTYNYSTAATTLDSYTVPDIKITTGDIYGVSVIPWVKKSDAFNTRTIRPFYRLSSADTFGSAVAVPDTQYEQKPTIFDGNGAAAWTVANVNALEIGVEDTS